MSSTKIAQALIYVSALAWGVGCTQSDGPSSNGAGLTAEDMAMLDAPEVDCGGPGDSGDDVDVGFACPDARDPDSVTTVDVASCKDLSNVVLRFTDGSTQKFDGLSGRTGTFEGTGRHDGKEIEAVYVKSGNNKSGDGPGYGEKFESPDSCIPGDGSDSGTSTGNGGEGDGTLDDDGDGHDDDGDGKIDEDYRGDGDRGDWDGDGDGHDDDGDGKIDEDYRGDGDRGDWDGDGDGHDDDGDGKIDEDYVGDGSDGDGDGYDDDGDGKIDEDYVGDGSDGDGSDGGVIIR